MLTKRELAEDVIKWVKSGKIVPESNYFSWRESNENAREQFHKQQICYVCVQGSIFLAALDKKNCLSTLESFDYCHEKLAEYSEAFSKTELLQLEQTFEFWDNFGREDKSWYNGLLRENIDRVDWMIRLMEYVIEHDGFDLADFRANNKPKAKELVSH